MVRTPWGVEELPRGFGPPGVLFAYPAEKRLSKWWEREGKPTDRTKLAILLAEFWREERRIQELLHEVAQAPGAAVAIKRWERRGLGLSDLLKIHRIHGVPCRWGIALRCTSCRQFYTDNEPRFANEAGNFTWEVTCSCGKKLSGSSPARRVDV